MGLDVIFMKLKLNNRGWGLSTFLVYLTIFIVFIGVVTILAIHNANKFKDVDRNDQNTSSEVSKEESNKTEKKSDFKQIEKDLEKAAYQYQQSQQAQPNNGSTASNDDDVVDADFTEKN